MTDSVSPLAGKRLEPAMLVDVGALTKAYFDRAGSVAALAAGRLRHFGPSRLGLLQSFNEAHILAIAQAICLYRRQQGIDGPLFLGIDTHALSRHAFETVLEVFAANGVDHDDRPEARLHADAGHLARDSRRITAAGPRPRPTASSSRLRTTRPADGGFKYNPPHGGPADTDATGWIEKKANDLLAAKLAGISRIPYDKALERASSGGHDYLGGYVADLADVVDMEAIARPASRSASTRSAARGSTTTRRSSTAMG